MEQTLILIKPDAVARHLVGRILARYEEKGFRLVAMKLLHMDEAMAVRHYAEHVGKDFYPNLVRFITSGPMVAAVLEGREAVAAVRALNGATDPVQAAPGTIRGDFGLSHTKNVVHSSDSPKSAEREIALFFTPQECVMPTAHDVDWTT